jgi:hypothetical protein
MVSNLEMSAKDKLCATCRVFSTDGYGRYQCKDCMNCYCENHADEHRQTYPHHNLRIVIRPDSARVHLVQDALGKLRRRMFESLANLEEEIANYLETIITFKNDISLKILNQVEYIEKLEKQLSTEKYFANKPICNGNMYLETGKYENTEHSVKTDDFPENIANLYKYSFPFKEDSRIIKSDSDLMECEFWYQEFIECKPDENKYKALLKGVKE